MSLPADENEDLIPDLADRVLADIRRGRGGPRGSLKPMVLATAVAWLMAAVGACAASSAWDSLFNPVSELANPTVALENR